MVQATPMMPRKSAVASMTKTQAQQRGTEGQDEEGSGGYDSNQDVYTSDENQRPRKKAKATRKTKGAAAGRGEVDMLALLETPGPSGRGACLPPSRRHRFSYHRPLLLDDDGGDKARADLLTWFDGVSTSRSMPWRKDWLDPGGFGDQVELREALKRRAYEVWISEIMLQQTRVSTVIGYWTNWIAKWPTIEDLARAEPEEVLSAWRGLGYYSRATRIHTAAKSVVEDAEMRGLLPESAELLQKNVPGVGRYTGGAIASIVFGNAAAMVDGNVLRVLSRQVGLYSDVKTSKQVIDALWNIADALVSKVASHGGKGKSDRPGRWGQALMELGSTVCTPHPVCRSCPITATCRAFSEGKLLAAQAGLADPVADAQEAPVDDMEDLCKICEPFGEPVPDEDVSKAQENSKDKKGASAKQSTLASFAFTNGANSKTKTKATNGTTNVKAIESIESHARKFPTKVVKKAVREQETIVCAIRNQNNEYMLHQRPKKGLLAGLWELPSTVLPESNDSVKSMRSKQASTFVKSMLGKSDSCQHKGEVDSVPWLFSHLKLTMHVHLFLVTTTDVERSKARWATEREVEEESMGTGMRKCWSLVKEL